MGFVAAGFDALVLIILCLLNDLRKHFVESHYLLSTLDFTTFLWYYIFTIQIM